jgi:septal ring factor EnvC (AmiA/AmiB activator)
MSRSHHAAGVLLVAVFGLWGCSRAPSADTGSAGTAEKLKAVETKLARLEDDFRAAASARDQLSKKLIAAEDARTALSTQVDRLGKETKAKDEQIATRTAERDLAAGQFKALKDELKELLAKAENGMKSEGSPMVPVIPTSNVKPELPAIPDVPKPGK